MVKQQTTDGIAKDRNGLDRSIGRILRRIRQEGLGKIIRRRLRWYWSMIRVNNRRVGRLVEILGNRIRIEGLVFSVDSPTIDRAHKSTLFFGLHELDERSLLKQFLPRDLPIVEFGGGIGVISCLANRRIGQRERHIVVEANPHLIPLLEKNRTLNRCAFTVVNKALAYDGPTVAFTTKSQFVGGGVGVGVNGCLEDVITVPTTTMKEIADAAGLDEFSLICDIEGAEAALVCREIETLRARVPFLLVEVHPGVLGSDRVNVMLGALRNAAYVVLQRCGDNLALARTSCPT